MKIQFCGLALVDDAPVPPVAIGTVPVSEIVGFWPPLELRTPLAPTDCTTPVKLEPLPLNDVAVTLPLTV